MMKKCCCCCCYKQLVNDLLPSFAFLFFSFFPLWPLRAVLFRLSLRLRSSSRCSQWEHRSATTSRPSNRLPRCHWPTELTPLKTRPRAARVQLRPAHKSEKLARGAQEREPLREGGKEREGAGHMTVGGCSQDRTGIIAVIFIFCVIAGPAFNLWTLLVGVCFYLRRTNVKMPAGTVERASPSAVAATPAAGESAPQRPRTMTETRKVSNSNQ